MRVLYSVTPISPLGTLSQALLFVALCYLGDKVGPTPESHITAAALLNENDIQPGEFVYVSKRPGLLQHLTYNRSAGDL